jgi:hypothetical protein
MSNIPMPAISPAFTIEDIHKIRAWHYEKREGMSPREICEDTRKGAERFLSLLNSPVEPDILAEVNKRSRSTRK